MSLERAQAALSRAAHHVLRARVQHGEDSEHAQAASERYDHIMRLYADEAAAVQEERR